MILLTGGTGTVGRAAVAALEAAGARFTLATRSFDKARGQPTVAFDWDRPETYQTALQGMDTVLVLTPVSDQVVRYTVDLAAAAKGAGVSRIVKLSVVGASMEGRIAFQRAHGACEKVLLEQGLLCTMVRANAFFQNFVLHYGVDPTTDGSFFLPHGNGKVGWVDATDVGAVIAATLLDDRHAGRTYEVTGPRSIGAAEMARILSEALSKKISYVDVPEAAARAAMSSAGSPPWLVDGLIELHASIRAGYLDLVSDGINAVLGRDARTAQSYARDLAASLRS